MLKTEIMKLIDKRKSYHSEDYMNIEKVWKELTDKICENITDSINYLLNDCSYEEFYWMSEIFDDVVDRTQSKEFVDCIVKVFEKYKDISEANGDHTDLSIEAAKNRLD